MNKALIILLISTNAIAGAAKEEEVVTELDELTVSASANKPAPPVTPSGQILTDKALRLTMGNTIGDTLKNELGLTNQSFGAGVGTPVIRGQAGSRVKVMQNGVGNNDVSNLSPDHANSVEPLLAERIEVLRGPASLLYSSGAMGGVVNVLDNRIPEQLPNKPVGGAAEQRYDSASNQTASVLKVEGGYQGLAYHLDGFYRRHGTVHIGGLAIDEAAARATDPTLNDVPILSNSKGRVQDTRGDSRGGSVGLSYIGEKGFIGASINRLLNDYGIPADGTDAPPVRIALKQTKYDVKGQLNQPFALIETLRYTFGYTDYGHTELNNGIPATRFLNQSFENRLELNHQPLAGWQGKIGFQSTHSQFAALGAESIVPRARQAHYALFFSEAVTLGAVDYALGGRGEVQTLDTETGRHFAYLPLSASASALWKINPHHQLSLAFTHTERSPSIQELVAKGLHDATRSYEVGNAALGKEYGNNLDLTYRYQAPGLAAEVTLFQNWVKDYIYQERSGDVFNSDLRLIENVCSTGSAACLPVQHTKQADAIFRGFETKLVAPLFNNTQGQLDLTLFSDYTRGYFVSGDNVPRMPPLRYGFQFDYTFKDLATNLRLTRAEAQHFTPAYDTPTRGYLLLNLAANYQIAHFHDSKVLLFASGKNLLNENIRNSTSYLRNFSPEPGRSAEIGVRVSY